jgi:hypothetical protein
MPDVQIKEQRHRDERPAEHFAHFTRARVTMAPRPASTSWFER